MRFFCWAYRADDRRAVLQVLILAAFASLLFFVLMAIKEKLTAYLQALRVFPIVGSEFRLLNC
jgi:hypothetical protein